MSYLQLLDKLTLRRITRWSKRAEVGHEYKNMDPGEAADIRDANVVMSLRSDSRLAFFDDEDKHALLLDLDVPAHLIQSSTPGHSHLYVDVAIPESRYFALLDLLAECGVIEHGYAGASRAKGGSYLRLPWVKKEDQDAF